MILIHGNGSEPALPEMPGAPTAGVNNAGIAAVHGRKRLAQPVAIGRHQDEMHMVGHQAPGPDLDIGPAALRGEKITVERIICVAEESARAAVAALGDMVRSAGDNDASEAGHAESMALPGADVN